MSLQSTTSINPGPVFCAGLTGSIEAGQTTMPSMRSTLTGWFKPMTVGVVTYAIAASGPNAGESVPTVREVDTAGVLQPDDEDLQQTRDGERSWSKWVLHVYPQLDVETDARLAIKGKKYRVLSKKNFTANGYIRYGLQEDYDAA